MLWGGYFSQFCGYIPGEESFKEGLLLAYSLRMQSITVSGNGGRSSRWLTTLHPRSGRRGGWALLSSLLFPSYSGHGTQVHRMLRPIVRVGLSTSVKPPQKGPGRYAQMRASTVILNPSRPTRRPSHKETWSEVPGVFSRRWGPTICPFHSMFQL